VMLPAFKLELGGLRLRWTLLLMLSEGSAQRGVGDERL